jgi:hypothetical protein
VAVINNAGKLGAVPKVGNNFIKATGDGGQHTWNRASIDPDPSQMPAVKLVGTVPLTETGKLGFGEHSTVMVLASGGQVGVREHST